ncbi:hypothetical protein VTK73DRAFT_6671 [Phialemonium thermophilum]|uniref:Uncharacterized protein n=1 Tax=Phialemonium thermophilum TaxID=223376 RepID=A0ABR3WIQ6_9PEZI
MQQNTLTLVPNPASMQRLVQRRTDAASVRPPMTSKQAKKLYKQATRQPRMSKAEQKRLEKEEQERIRKELEKEKQAARARQARERRKAKEMEALQEKKRKGLPTVTVRPSQDTISRFIRGNGTGRKRDAEGTELHLPSVIEERESTESAREPDQDENPQVKEQQDESQNLVTVAHVTTADQSQADGHRVNRQGPGQEVDERKKPFDTSTAAGDAETSLSTQKALDTSDAAVEVMNNSQILSESGAVQGVSSEPVPPPKVRSGQPPSHVLSKTMGPSLPPGSNSAPAPRPPPPCQPGSSGQSRANPLGEMRSSHLNIRPKLDSTTASPAKFLSASRPAQKITEKTQHHEMSCSAVPRFMAPNLATGKRIQTPPRFLPKRMQSMPNPRPGAPPQGQAELDRPCPGVTSTPPTSTQLFVLSHLDELFPSPSQEVRELFESGPPRRVASSSLVQPRKPTGQARTLLPQAALEPPPRRAEPKPTARATTHPATETRPRAASENGSSRTPVMGPPPPPNQVLSFDPLPFFSTQDLMLSSQDMRELEQPSETSFTALKSAIDKSDTFNDDMAAISRHSSSKRSPAITNTARFATEFAERTCVRHLPIQVENPDRSLGRSSETSHREPRKVPGRTVSCAPRAQSVLTSSHRSSGAQHNGQKATIGSAPSSAKSVVHSAKSKNSSPPSLPTAGPAAADADMTDPSPPKRRFFTSSNAEGVYLAIERSRRTFREEQRAREAARRVQECAERRLKEGEVQSLSTQGEMAGQHGEHLGEEELALLAEQLAEDMDQEYENPVSVVGPGIQGVLDRSSQTASKPPRDDQLRLKEDAVDAEGRVPNFSQETDYGDPDWVSEMAILVDSL